MFTATQYEGTPPHALGSYLIHYTACKISSADKQTKHTNRLFVCHCLLLVVVSMVVNRSLIISDEHEVYKWVSPRGLTDLRRLPPGKDCENRAKITETCGAKGVVCSVLLKIAEKADVPEVLL